MLIMKSSCFLFAILSVGSAVSVTLNNDSPNLGAYIASGLQIETSTTSSPKSTITPGSVPIFANNTNAISTDLRCQTSWNIYWSSLEAYQMGGVSGTKTFTYNTSTPTTVVVYAETTSQVVKTEYITRYILDASQKIVFASLGSYPPQWYSTLSYSTSTYIYSVYPLTSASTNREYDVVTTAFATAPAPSPTQPTCSPPIDSADCSASWSEYSSSMGETTWWQRMDYDPPMQTTMALTPPSCYNPPINTSSCSTIQDQFHQKVANGLVSLAYNPAVSLAPGCTLGCGKCSLAASNFQILYWGTQTSSVTATASVTAVVGDGTTLTSPQVYLSFTKLWATDSCSDVGTTIQDGIVAINTNHLSRVGVINGLALSGTGQLNPTGGGHYLYTTALPFSQFLQWQASNTTAFHLSLPDELRTLESEWSNCDQITIGIPEPPSVLTAATLALPVEPSSLPPATPALAITTSVASTTTALMSTPTAFTPSDQPQDSMSLSEPLLISSQSLPQTGSVISYASPVTEISQTGGLLGPSVKTTKTAVVSSSTPIGDPNSQAQNVGSTSQTDPSASQHQNVSPNNAVIITLSSITITAIQTYVPASSLAYGRSQDSAWVPALIIGSETILAGGPPAAIGDQTISLAPQQAIATNQIMETRSRPADGVGQVLNTASQQAGQTLTQSPKSAAFPSQGMEVGIVIGGTTITTATFESENVITSPAESSIQGQNQDSSSIGGLQNGNTVLSNPAWTQMQTIGNNMPSDSISGAYPVSTTHSQSSSDRQSQVNKISSSELPSTSTSISISSPTSSRKNAASAASITTKTSAGNHVDASKTKFSLLALLSIVFSTI